MYGYSATSSTAPSQCPVSTARLAALTLQVRRSGHRGHPWNEVGVAYQLLAEKKRARARAAQIVEAARTEAVDSRPTTLVPLFAAARSIELPGYSAAQQAASVAAAAAAANARRRRWYLGIQSKKDPAHVMAEASGGVGLGTTATMLTAAARMHMHALAHTRCHTQVFRALRDAGFEWKVRLRQLHC